MPCYLLPLSYVINVNVLLLRLYGILLPHYCDVIHSCFLRRYAMLCPSDCDVVILHLVGCRVDNSLLDSRSTAVTEGHAVDSALWKLSLLVTPKRPVWDP